MPDTDEEIARRAEANRIVGASILVTGIGVTVIVVAIIAGLYYVINGSGS